MEANELRKGNIVNWRGERAVISQIWEVEVVFKCGEIGMIDDLRPVPLSDIWLIAHDFERGSFILEKDDKGYYYSAGEGVKLSPYIESVHQLQNLYFAHNLKELLCQKRK
nr:hypothetical protein [uncultured Draconibacterium sp.]